MSFAVAHPPFGPAVAAIVPGLALTSAIAAAAFALRQLPGMGVLSPMILAILLGIAFHNLIGTPAGARPGVAFALRRVLRAAIVLLGLQLTAAQVVAVGGIGIAIIVATLLASFFFTRWLGRLLGVSSGLAELIGAGTAICGASAVIAVNTVTRAREEDVAYAVACVTLFGTLSMFAYPLLPAVLGLDAHRYGLWAGASIHEIAQVVAAAFQAGPVAGQFGTVAKLSRVMLLAPMVLALGMLRRSEGVEAKAPMPWFAFGFVALMLLNSVVAIPAPARTVLVILTTALLSLALAAMGLVTDFSRLRAAGLRPLLLGAASWIFISTVSLILIEGLT